MLFFANVSLAATMRAVSLLLSINIRSSIDQQLDQLTVSLANGNQESGHSAIVSGL